MFIYFIFDTPAQNPFDQFFIHSVPIKINNNIVIQHFEFIIMIIAIEVGATSLRTVIRIKNINTENIIHNNNNDK